MDRWSPVARCGNLGHVERLEPKMVHGAEPLGVYGAQSVRKDDAMQRKRMHGRVGVYDAVHRFSYLFTRSVRSRIFKAVIDEIGWRRQSMLSGLTAISHTDRFCGHRWVFAGAKCR